MPGNRSPDYPTTIQDNAAVTGGMARSTRSTATTGSDDTSTLYCLRRDYRELGPDGPAADTREAPAGGFVGGMLIVSGGWGSTGDPDGKTEIYDPSANSWTTGAPQPGCRWPDPGTRCWATRCTRSAGAPHLPAAAPR